MGWKNRDLSVEQHLGLLGHGVACPGYWATIVGRQLDRINAEWHRLDQVLEEAARTGTPIPPDDPDHFNSDPRILVPSNVSMDALLMIFAADQVRTLVLRYISLAPKDPSIALVLRELDATAPTLADARDRIAHIDHYAVGTGNQSADTPAPTLGFDPENDEHGRRVLFIGPIRLDVYATAYAAMNAATEADQWWESTIDSLVRARLADQ